MKHSQISKYFSHSIWRMFIILKVLMHISFFKEEFKWDKIDKKCIHLFFHINSLASWYRVSTYFYDSLSNPPSSNWDTENGYDEEINRQSHYPHRAFETGRRGMLVVIMRTMSFDADHLCGGPVQGIKISFHPFVFFSKHFFLLLFFCFTTWNVALLFSLYFIGLWD